MVSINTNVNALYSNASLATNQTGQTRAMQQLSTGLRINSARDDAAGMVITTRMNSSVRGMATAIKNINDGISLAQIADSSLSSVQNNLQRIRELAIQSATGTLGDSNRKNMQLEVQQLVNQIDNVSSTTNFNGIKVFAGLSNKLTLQTNANSGDNVSLKIPLMNSRTLGLGHRSALMAQGIASISTPINALNKSLLSGDLIINGVTIGSSSSKDDAISISDKDSSAISKVAAINKFTDKTGVFARVGTTVASGVPMSVGAAGKAGTLTINGVSTGIITLKGDLGSDRGQAVKAINLVSKQTGVRAVDMGSDNLGVQLIADDGRNITIYSTSLSTSSDFNLSNLGVNGVSYSAGAQISNVGIFTGTYSLQSLNDEPITIGTQTTGNITNSGLAEGKYDINESYINSLQRPSVSSDQNIPPIISTSQGGTIPGVTENSIVNFGQLGIDDTLTIGGLKLTATAPMTVAEVAAAFQNISDGGNGATSKGIFTGSLLGWKSDAAIGNTVKFTSTTANTDVPDLTISNTYYSSDPVVSVIVPGSPHIPPSSGQPEIDTVRFDKLDSGQSFTLFGKTATGPLSAKEVGDLFANNNNLNGWSTGGNSNGAVPFICNSNITSDINNPSIPHTSPYYVVQGQQAGKSPNIDTPPTIEVDGITFSNLSAGDQLIVGGLTLTASSNMTADEVATAFASIASGTNGNSLNDPSGKGSFSGALINWSSSPASGNSVTFTNITSGYVGKIPVLHMIITGGKPSVITEIKQGYPLITNTETASVQFGNLHSGTFLSIGGLTLTAIKDMSAEEVTKIFVNLSDGANSSTINADLTKCNITGTLTGWNTKLSGGNVIFTSTIPNTDVKDISISYTKSIVPKGIQAGDLRINGFEIPPSIEKDDTASNSVATSSKKDASAISIAAAVNKVSLLTKVNAVPKPNVIVGGGFTYKSNNNGTLYINSFPVKINAVLASPPPVSTLGQVSIIQVITPGQIASSGSPATPEVDSIILPGLAKGQSLTIAGITVSATSADMSAQNVQSAFANLNDGDASSNPNATGNLTGWKTSTLGSLTVFTRSVTGPSAIHIPNANIIPGAPATPALPAVNEVSKITFGQLAAGDSVTVSGLTLTAVSFMKADEVASMFSNIADGGKSLSTLKGNITGNLVGFSSANATNNQVTFTCSSAGPTLSNSSIFYSNIAQSIPKSITKVSDIVASINSIAGETGVYASDNGSGITLTAPDGRNISLATGTDPATNTLTLENLGLGPSSIAMANQNYPALKINGGPEGAITTYSTVVLNSDKSFTMTGGAKDSSLADINLLGFRENTYGGSNDGIKIAYVDISTIDGANDALAAVENAIAQISDIRSNLGAVQNKLLSAIENLTSSETNTQQSASRISDTDYGIATTELARNQIINQAATAMLAQANQQTQLVMQLLKNNG